MLINGYWIGVRDGDFRALALMKRHYSRHEYKDGRPHCRFVGPGQRMVMITEKCDALFIWRRFIESGQSEPKGINCAVFRNESNILSSTLIKEAMELAWQRWPGELLYTYVNPKCIRSSNPGLCFIKAGWQRSGKSKKGLIILDVLPRNK